MCCLIWCRHAVERDKETLRALGAQLRLLPSLLDTWNDAAQAGLGVDEETATVVMQVRPNTPGAALPPPPCGPHPC